MDCWVAKSVLPLRPLTHIHARKQKRPPLTLRLSMIGLLGCSQTHWYCTQNNTSPPPLTMRLSMIGLLGSLSSSFWYRPRASTGLFISSKYMPCSGPAGRPQRTASHNAQQVTTHGRAGGLDEPSTAATRNRGAADVRTRCTRSCSSSGGGSLRGQPVTSSAAHREAAAACALREALVHVFHQLQRKLLAAALHGRHSHLLVHVPHCNRAGQGEGKGIWASVCRALGIAAADCVQGLAVSCSTPPLLPSP